MSGSLCGKRALVGDASAPLKEFVRADAAVCECELQDRELCAGERLRLAGFSSGTGVGARGERIRLHGIEKEASFAMDASFFIEHGSVSLEMRTGLGALIQAFCVRFMSVIRFYWNVLRSVHACCLPRTRQTGRLATGCISIPRGSGSP